MPIVHITVVTYRRPKLLERALKSLLAQTLHDWEAEIRNDDPSDSRPAKLVESLGDYRLKMASVSDHQGATAHFNQAFMTTSAAYASILEDDNWWEPNFLSTMLNALQQHPEIDVACGNEKLWRQNSDESWTDTETTIWPLTHGSSLFPFRMLDKCGPAKLCNSSLLFKTCYARQWLIPDSIPVDVSEHFRERRIPHPFLLVHEPLVNYAETLNTARSSDPLLWGTWQILLIGSAFTLTSPALREHLAQELWTEVRRHRPLSASSLLWTALAVPEASLLWKMGNLREKTRWFLGLLRRPQAWSRLRNAPLHQAETWSFLIQDSAITALTNINTEKLQ